MRLILLLTSLVFSATVSSGAFAFANEGKPECNDSDMKIHNARAELYVYDTKNMIQQDDHLNPEPVDNLYTNSWNTVPATEKPRIIKEFTETLIPYLLVKSYENYMMLQSLNCESSDKTEVMAYIKAFNNKLLTKKIIIAFNHSISDDASDYASTGGEKGLEAVCGKDVSLEDPCFRRGVVTGGLIGTVVSYPVGLAHAIATAHKYATGKVVIPLPQGAEAYRIP